MFLIVFFSGPYRDQLTSKLQAAGATVTSRLLRSTNYLIVASPSSAHSDCTTPSAKLEHAVRSSPDLPLLKVVWEGWVDEVVRCGGTRSVRDLVWQWSKGGSEPGEQELREEELPGGMIKRKESSTRLDSTLIGATLKTMDVDAVEDGPVVVTRRARPLRDERSFKDPLLEAFSNPSQSTQQLQRTHTTIPPPSVSAIPLRRELLPDDTFDFGSKKGKSIIKAISTSKSNSFNKPAQTTATSKSPPTHSMQHDTTVLDHSQKPIESINLRSDASEPDLPIFQGMKFSLMALSTGNLKAIRECIEKRGGRILIDLIENDTDWICVEFFK